MLPGYLKQFIGNKKQLTNKTLNYADISFYPEKEVTAILNAATDQNQCEKWYMIRCGRTTASVMKDVCIAKPEMPLLSFIEKIYY